MAVAAFIPALGTVVVSALIDSINPCAIGVLVLMISVLLAGKKSRRTIALYGLAYILAVMAVYILAGLGLVYLFASIPLVVSEYLSIVVATIIVIAGMLEVKDYFWYGRGFSLAIPSVFAKRLHGFAAKQTLPAIIALGALVSAVELPCTGAPYLAIITFLSQYFDLTAFLLLILYNVIFVLPLFAILGLVLLGVKLHSIKRWKQSNKPLMRLLTGLLLVFLGWLLLLIAAGHINFG